MARTSLGGVEFEAVLNDSALLQQLAQAEAQSRAAAAKVQSAINTELNKLKVPPIVPVVNTKPAEQQISKLQQLFQGASRGAIAGSNLGGGLILGAGIGIAGGAAVGVQALTSALIGGAAAGLKYNAELEQSAIKFKLFTGSAEDANRAIQGLKGYADRTPFDTQEVLKAGSAFISVTNGDIAAMQKMVQQAGALAATNTGPGGGLEGATIAIRELLGGDIQSFAERFNVQRSALTALKNSGLEGLALVQAAVKLARGSEELVDLFGQTGAGQLSTFSAALATLGQEASKPLFEALTQQVTELNRSLVSNGPALSKFATDFGTGIASVEKGLFSAIQAYAEFDKQVVQSGLYKLTHTPGTPGPAPGPVVANAFNEAVRPETANAGHAIGPGGSALTARAEEERAARAEMEKTATVERQNDERRKTADAAKIKAGQEYAKQRKEQDEEITKGAIASIDAQMDAVKTAADEQKAIIEAQRDNKLAALKTQHEAELKAIDEAEQASKDSYAKQIKDAEIARDAALKAADAKRDGAIKALDAEQTARDRARTLEDRGREAVNATAERAAERQHDAVLRGLDAEKTAIESKRDAALKAIESEIRAEDRRHNQTIRNIDAEQKRALGEISKELDALDAQRQQEGRSETDKDLAEALDDARKARSKAKTKDERKAADRDVRDAEEAISKESRRRQDEDKRAELATKAEAIRTKAAADKQYADDKSALEKEGLEAFAGATKEEATVALTAVQQRVKDEQDAYAAETQARRDAYAVQSQLLADKRYAEDQELASRRTAVQEAYTAEQAAIKATYDDEATGSIPALRRAAEAAEREYARQKAAAKENYDAAQLAIKATADASERELDRQTKNEIAKLQESKNEWLSWSTYVQKQIEDAIKGVPGAAEKLRTLGPFPGTNRTSGGGAGPGGGGGPTPPGFGGAGDEQRLSQVFRIAAAAGGEEVARIVTAISAREGISGGRGDGGSSFGPLQFHTPGQLENFAKYLGVDIETAKKKAESDWTAAIEFAVYGYLGDKIREGQAMGLSGAELATHASTGFDTGSGRFQGQTSKQPELSGDKYRQLFGDPATRDQIVKAAAEVASYVLPIEGLGPDQINPHWGSAMGGTDIFAPAGTPVHSIGAGTVLRTGSDATGGNTVLIAGADGRTYYYAHLIDAAQVKAGEQVLPGQILGGVGQTGNAAGTPPHLHLGVGDTILSGTGPLGGTGTNFDLVTFLRDLAAEGKLVGPVLDAAGVSLQSMIDTFGEGSPMVEQYRADLARLHPEIDTTTLSLDAGTTSADAFGVQVAETAPPVDALAVSTDIATISADNFEAAVSDAGDSALGAGLAAQIAGDAAGNSADDWGDLADATDDARKALDKYEKEMKDAINQQLEAVGKKKTGKAKDLPISDVPSFITIGDFGGNAAGGNTYDPGQWGIVGEGGAELVRFPNGGQVYSHAQSLELAEGGLNRSGATYNLNGIGINEAYQALKQLENENRVLYGGRWA